jgi:hypothetical protein
MRRSAGEHGPIPSVISSTTGAAAPETRQNCRSVSESEWHSVDVDRFEIERRVAILNEPDDFYAPTDIAVPVVDGVPLFETLGAPFPGIDVRLVINGSQQWLGQPRYEEDGRAVVLDGLCGTAACCGVMAKIVVDGDLVRWHDFVSLGGGHVSADLTFSFHRPDYVLAIDRVMALVPVPWIAD